MSNIIDSIQLSGTVYTIQGSGGGSGNPTVELTQAEYDALVSAGTVSANTYYIITDAQAGDLTQYWTSAQTQSAINQATSGKVDTSSVVTAVTSGSTDSEIPTAKAVYDAIPSATTYSAGRGINITNDTISFSLPISAGTGAGSIVEGDAGNISSGISSHAEGSYTKALYSFAHAEGFGTSAFSQSSHAEGENTSALGAQSHAEGRGTKASGSQSHAEGWSTSALTDYSHAEGHYTITNNQSEHASGQYNVSFSASTTFGNSGNTLFSVGNGTSKFMRHNAFEIRQNGDIYLTKDGVDIKLQDNLGSGGIDSGTVQTMIDESISGKQDTLSAGTGISIVDNVISATGGGGGKAISAGTNISVTTGETADTISCTLPITANSAMVKSVSIGAGNSVSNHCDGSIAVGYNCSFSNVGTDGAAVIGWYCNAKKDFSFAQGNFINANNQSEHSVGQYNVSSSASTTFGNSGNTLFSVGNGTADNARHNAFEIRQNGDIYLSSGGTDIKLQDYLGSTIEVSSAITSGDTNAVAGGAVYDKFDEVEQVTARALNELNEKINALIEANEVVARALNDLNDRITALENA